MFALLWKSIFFLFLRSLCAENGKCFLEIKWQTLNFEQKKWRHFHLESNYNWRWRDTKLDTDLHWNREQMAQMGFKVRRLLPSFRLGHNDISSSWINKSTVYTCRIVEIELNWIWRWWMAPPLGPQILLCIFYKISRGSGLRRLRRNILG